MTEIGTRFGKLIVVELGMRLYGRPAARCQCDCGEFKMARISDLRRGFIISCGCAKIESQRARCTTHGNTDSPTYRSWAAMKNRCLNPEATGWKNYGGRGIRLCDRWLNFENFLADMGERPSLKYSIERKNVNGDYEPENCRWATVIEQARNKNRTIFVVYLGQVMPLVEACEKAGIIAGTARCRVYDGRPFNQTRMRR